MQVKYLWDVASRANLAGITVNKNVGPVVYNHLQMME